MWTESNLSKYSTLTWAFFLIETDDLRRCIGIAGRAANYDAIDKMRNFGKIYDMYKRCETCANIYSSDPNRSIAPPPPHLHGVQPQLLLLFGADGGDLEAVPVRLTERERRLAVPVQIRCGGNRCRGLAPNIYQM